MKRTGQELYEKAKKLIPGGTMLLSKRPEMFLPNNWPSYFSKAKGCKLWDLDGNEYLDMSLMGIGTNILGYGNEMVDKAVMKTVANGNLSTLNCPEEVLLAERLVEIHPWADMVRFARSGGEANAMAIRIARAASGKDKVAICGYHGWHDWYLSANLGDDQNLSGHLLPGLNPLGVPKNLCKTVIPFKYNDIQELKDIIANNSDLGVIKMEVSRNMGPLSGYLEEIRQLATRHNIILIFDECTSGFRQTFGGLYKLYNVEPDMAIFGKTLGNGYAITSVIGRREIMNEAQKTFISSTFWTERIGPSAALATLEEMEKVKSWEVVTETGNLIRKNWTEIAKSNGISLEIGGIPALSTFTIPHPHWLTIKTYITQELLKKGILGSNAIYVCTEHKESDLNRYFNELDKLLSMVKARIINNDSLIDLLEGPVCHGGFKRLN